MDEIKIVQAESDGIDNVYSVIVECTQWSKGCKGEQARLGPLRNSFTLLFTLLFNGSIRKFYKKFY